MQIRMSIGSVPKCCGCIILLVSVISPSIVQIGRWLYEKRYQMSTNPPRFRNGEENEKVIWNPHADPGHHQKLVTSRGSPLAHACQVWPTSVSAFVRSVIHPLQGPCATVIIKSIVTCTCVFGCLILKLYPRMNQNVSFHDKKFSWEGAQPHPSAERGPPPHTIPASTPLQTLPSVERGTPLHTHYLPHFMGTGTAVFTV